MTELVYQVQRTHRYANGKEVVTEAIVMKSFSELVPLLYAALKMDEPEGTDWFESGSPTNFSVTLVSMGQRGETSGANIMVKLDEAGDSRTRVSIGPQHPDWDTSYWQMVSVASTLAYALGR